MTTTEEGSVSTTDETEAERLAREWMDATRIVGGPSHHHLRALLALVAELRGAVAHATDDACDWAASAATHASEVARLTTQVDDIAAERDSLRATVAELRTIISGKTFSDPIEVANLRSELANAVESAHVRGKGMERAEDERDRMNDMLQESRAEVANLRAEIERLEATRAEVVRDMMHVLRERDRLRAAIEDTPENIEDIAAQLAVPMLRPQQHERNNARRALYTIRARAQSPGLDALALGPVCTHGLYQSRCERCGAEPMNASVATPTTQAPGGER